LLLSVVQTIPFESGTIEKARADSFWKQNTVSDFMTGTTNGTEISANGEIMLAKNIFYTEDNFFDESKINEKESVFVDTTNREARLLKINKIYGGTEMDGGHSVQQTNDGGYIILGDSYSYGQGNYDFWLIKTDAEGTELWNKTFGGGAYDYGRSVLVTPDGGYLLCGHTSSSGAGWFDLWLIKTNANGTEQWSKTYGGANFEQGFSIQPTNDGGYIITGSTESFGTGATTIPAKADVWLIKIDSKGSELWSKTFGGTDYDIGHSVQQTSNGGYIITGVTQSDVPNADMWLIKTNSKGTEQWNKTFGGTNNAAGQAVVEADDGGYVATGAIYNDATSSTDVLMVKTDKNGNVDWIRTHGGNVPDEGFSIVKTDDSGFIIAGLTWTYDNDNADLWLLKTDHRGLEEWNKTIGWSSDEVGHDVIKTLDGGYIITGYTQYYTNKKSDFWLVRTDEQGNESPIGSLISNNLLVGQSTSQINNFFYTSSIPQGTEIKIQFSKDAYIWYNTNNETNVWDSLLDGTNSIDLSSLNWETSNFYYRLKFSSENSKMPSISNINVSYSNYFLNGAFESVPFDSGARSNWKNISWVADEPDGTFVKFQVRTGKTIDDLLGNSYVGLYGNSSYYYTNNNEPIWEGHYGNRWLQVKAVLERSNYATTPMLKKINIEFNTLPEPAELLGPINNTLLNNSRPTFEWQFNDLDSDVQESFQWQADDASDFSSSDYNSGVIKSSTNKFTPSSSMSDGIWYWRVRTMDIDGDWGAFSNYSMIMIDTTIKKPMDLLVNPNNWTATNIYSISWSNPDDLSGIIGAYYKLDIPPISNYDGTYVPAESITSIDDISVSGVGEHTIFIWLIDQAGNINFNQHTNAKLYLDTLAPAPPTKLTVDPDYWAANNSFSINWNVPTDHSGVKNGVYCYIGNSPPESQDVCEWIKGKPIRVNIDSEGENNIYLWLEDKLGNKNYLNHTMIEVKFDNSPPEISHTPITKVKNGKKIGITATITDEYSGVDRVLLNFKNSEDLTYSTIVMRQSGDNYHANITSNQITDNKIEYYLTAQDKSNPKNIIFFGNSGGTTIEPTATTDIDIKISEEGTGGFLGMSSNSLWLIVIVIIIIIFVMILFFYIRKNKKPELKQEERITPSTTDDSIMGTLEWEDTSAPFVKEESIDTSHPTEEPAKPEPESLEQAPEQALPELPPQPTEPTPSEPQPTEQTQSEPQPQLAEQTQPPIQPPVQAQTSPQLPEQTQPEPPQIPSQDIPVEPVIEENVQPEVLEEPSQIPVQPTEPELIDENPVDTTVVQQPVEQIAPEVEQEPVQNVEVQTVPCPICNKQIKVYSSPCPHCGTNMNW
jgi:hypothetical protein